MEKMKGSENMTEMEISNLHNIMEDLLTVSDSFAVKHGLEDSESFELMKIALLECIRAKIGGIDKTLYERI